MTIDPAVLERALGLFTNDPTPAMVGSFQTLVASVHSDRVEAASLDRVRRSLQNLVWRVWTLETLMLRVERQLADVRAQRLDWLIWMNYATADIDLFHVAARSLFDHVTPLMFATADHLAQFERRKRSFHRLRETLRKSARMRGLLGTEWSTLVLACDWFPILRTVRNRIVHDGSLTLVTTVDEGIAFQIITDGQHQLNVPELMINENSLEFTAYGGMVYGYILAFLDAVAEAAVTRLGMHSPLKATMRHPAHSVTRDWILRARKRAA